MKIYNIYVKIPSRYIEVDYMSDENPLLHKYTYYLTDIEKIYQLRHNDQYYTGLYAWTTDKKLLKVFLNDRPSSIYNVVKDNIDEYEFINRYYKTHQLKERKYTYINEKGEMGSMKIVSTKFEYEAVSDPTRILNDIFVQIVHYDYRLFNADIIDALDYLGYTKFYDRMFRYDDDDWMEFIDYNESFGVTASGHKDYFTFSNQVNLLIYLFDYFFTGINVDDPICEKEEK